MSVGERVTGSQPPAPGAPNPREAVDPDASPGATPGAVSTRPGAGVVRDRDKQGRRALLIADVLALVAALGLVLVPQGRLFLPAAVPWIGLVVGLCKATGLYGRDEHLLRKATLEDAPKLFYVLALTSLLLWLGEDVVLVGTLGQGELAVFFAVSLGLLLLARWAARGIVAHGTPQERCVVIGDATNALRLADHLSHGLVRARLVGRVPLEQRRRGDVEPAPSPGEPEVLGQLSELRHVLTEHDIQRVILAPRNSDAEEILDTIRVVKELGIKISILPRLFEAVESSVEFDHVGGTVLLALRQFGLSSTSRALKRGLDVAGAAGGLLVLSPLLGVLALAIKLSSPGPVFFRQPRIGRDDSEFQMVKFRSMVDGADRIKTELAHLNEAEGLFKIADDPRITRIGRFLRKSSLDELPQLWNVLRGEMSLVGPRPLVAEDDRRVEGWQRRRLGLSPGMTGVWQILGSARIPLHEMVKIDYLYIANWSLWSDIKILLRTVPYVLARRGM